MNGAAQPGSTAIRDKAAIVGIGTTNFGAVYGDLDPERSAYDLGMEALKHALNDAGLNKSDLDGLIVVRIPGYTRFAEMLGMPHLRLVNVLEGGGRMAGVALQYRSEEHTSELQSHLNLVCRLLLEKKKTSHR